MGNYQTYKGNAEEKRFFLVDNLIGGINTEFSDDTSSDNDFKDLINFTLDNRGSLYKRKGFGKQTALSEILNMFNDIPIVKGKSADNPFPEETNDNLVYAKLLRNDNSVFRNLAAFSGDKAYKKYQEMWGFQNNTFELLMLSTNKTIPDAVVSTAWLLKCTLPPLNPDNPDADTIIVSSQVYPLPVVMNWDKDLFNIDTIEYSDKIYFTSNNKGLLEFNRKTNTFNYYGTGIPGQTNKAYKPTSMEVRKIGFNLLGDDPLYWVNYEGITTDSIQGIYITSSDRPNVPTLEIPFGGKFRLNILYTGSNSGFSLEFKSGENKITHTSNSVIDKTGLRSYDIELKDAPTGEVEIKITKTSATLDPYYDYYPIDNVDPLAKPVEPLNIGNCGILEMYNRAVYYSKDTIWFSEPNNFNYIPNYNYIVLPIEPIDEITKIVFFKNVYIIFTKYRTYKMIGAFGASDFQLMPVNNSIGCHAPHTVVPVENELYFASTRGLYALRSSEFREGIENLKELDAKIKGLTSDVSMYMGELSDPAIKYNGISSKAYAVRYRDTYLLYFNTALEDGDMAAVNDLDALMYKYDLKSFTLMRHLIKPPFMFFVDNAIECFCTVPEREEYTKEETLLEYNFENATGSKIIDLSGNGNDADLMGGATVSPGYGMQFDGIDDFIKVANLPASLDLENGFALEFDVKFDELKSVSRLLDFAQSQSTGSAQPTSFSVWTNWNNGYRGELICNTSPDVSTGRDTVRWTLRYHRDSLSRNQAYSGAFRLESWAGNLIPYTNFNFNFGGGYYTDVASGSFVVQHDAYGNYSSGWSLFISSAYPTQQTNIGGPTSGGDWGSTGWSSKFGLYFGWRADANASGANLHIDIYDHFEQYSTLKIGARTANYCKGINFYAPAVSKTGSAAANVYLNSVDYWYGYTGGQPVLGIDGSHNIKATISGVYRENMTGSIGGVVLPAISQSTVWNWFDTNGSASITLPTISYPSKRNIAIGIVNSAPNYNFETSSEFGTAVVASQGVNSLERHKMSIIYNRYNSSIFNYSIYVDGALNSQGTINANTVKNALRDNCFIGKTQNNTGFFKGSIYGFKLYLYRSTGLSAPIINYTFDTGSGNTIYDKSGNGYHGTISGATWLTEKGLKLDGTLGYVKLPTIDELTRFSNGFTIQFEAKAETIVKNSKILDLAIEYGTGSASNKKASINVGFDTSNKQISLMSTSLNYKGFAAKVIVPNMNTRLKYKLSCIDNGKGYTVTISVNDVIINTEEYGYGNITNITRKSNFIGRSNNADDALFKGMIYNFKIVVNASVNPIPIYVGAMYEYDTTYDDFGKPIMIVVETKGMNFKYPHHIKKLKSITIKGTGGFAYQQFLCMIYCDGHLINDPRKYKCYVDSLGQVVYDYDVEMALEWNEKIALLGNMRLDYTKLGETTYETRKIVVPAKGKNFTIRIEGESSDFLGIQSFGFVFKLGKVKEG